MVQLQHPTSILEHRHDVDDFIDAGLRYAKFLSQGVYKLRFDAGVVDQIVLAVNHKVDTAQIQCGK